MLDLTASSLANSLNVPHLVARIAVSRGIKTVSEFHALLYGKESSVLDPFSMFGMKEAVEWILKVKESNESLFIFGDYDLDGLSSVALLVRGLSSLGISVKWRLPNRFGAGYGLSIDAIDEMLSAGAQKLITVDTGITANAEIAYAKEKGLCTMVIDHHQPSGEGLPCCDVLLDPHQEQDSYKNKDLCGVGVAYKFLCALYSTLNLTLPENFLELVALGTLADLVPMTPENRFFTRTGLLKMWESPFPGIKEICHSQLQFPQFMGAQGIIFKVAPLLNAPGRMEKPDPALDLLLCNNKESAPLLVKNLSSWNAKRKNKENEISKMAIQRVKELYGNDLPPVLVIDGYDWHLGVIGIVAAKMTQEFNRPSAVLSIQPDGVASASARAIPGFNWHKALFECRDLFSRWGGHANAAGFSIAKENIDLLRNKLNENVSAFQDTTIQTNTLPPIDVAFSELDDSLMLWLSRMEPLVGKFASPIFRASQVSISSLRELRGGHLYLELSQNTSARFSAIAFGMGKKKKEIVSLGKYVSVDFEIAWNVFNGRRSLQLQVKNIF